MPMNPADYPPNWREISQRIRFERAEGRCECEGECGRNHYRRVTEVQARDGRPGIQYDDRRCAALHGLPHPRTHSGVVLTVAHLDQDPASDDETRMRAMCQACHLAYDRVDRRGDSDEQEAEGHGEENPT